MPKRRSVPISARPSEGRTEHLATRVTVEERDLLRRAALARVRRDPQLLSMSDFIRSLIVEGARRELGEESNGAPRPRARRGAG